MLTAVNMSVKLPYMELTAEEAVTKLLSDNEILRGSNTEFYSNPMYNLGEFLKNFKPEPSPYEGKFFFIR